MQLSGQTCPGLDAGSNEVKEYLSRGFVSRPWGTYLLDLQGNDEVLLARMKSSARKAIRKAHQAKSMYVLLKIYRMYTCIGNSLFM